MELEEDLNLKTLDQVKSTYLQSFDYLKNGIPDQSLVQLNQQDDYLIENVFPIPLQINIKNGSLRQIFKGKDLYCENNAYYNVIGKSLEIEKNMIKMFISQKCYVLHNVLIYQMKNTYKNTNNQNEKNSYHFFKSSSNQINLQQNSNKNQQNQNNIKDDEFYYVVDENSQIFEDHDTDFIQTLTILSKNSSMNKSAFQIDYTQQLSQMQKPLNMAHLKLLLPQTINSFEGVISKVDEGKNLLQIEELIDQFSLNSKRDRFYKLTVKCAQNYLDQFDVYLIYDKEDQDAQQQLQFYLHQYQQIKIVQSIKHFDNKLQPFIISFFQSTGINTHKSNLQRFSIKQRGIEFFSKDSIDKNKILPEQMIKNYSNLPLSSLSTLSNNEMIMIRTHMKIYVKVKKIKYFKIRLNCANCKQEWTKGFKNCINCKETEQQISFGFQVLVQDQYFLEQQAYIYLYDEKAIQFFNITEQEKKDISNYLIKNDSYMQLYYSISKQYPLSIIKFKDRIFTQDISRYVVGVPFADLTNKLFNSNQLSLQEERMRVENEQFFNNIMEEESGQKIVHDHNKNINKKQIFINGTYIASNFFQGQKVILKPIPCLKVVYVFPQQNVVSQSLNVIEEIQNLKQKINQLQ